MEFQREFEHADWIEMKTYDRIAGIVCLLDSAGMDGKILKHAKKFIKREAER